MSSGFKTNTFYTSIHRTVLICIIHVSQCVPAVTHCKKIWKGNIENPPPILGLLICFTSFRYVRGLTNVVHAIQVKTKLCQLVEVMMERRDDLSFCQEMKFRSVF